MSLKVVTCTNSSQWFISVSLHLWKKCIKISVNQTKTLAWKNYKHNKKQDHYEETVENTCHKNPQIVPIQAIDSAKHRISLL